ncbi:MAG: type II toxin-antitoxin system VapB family antitoxin [Mariniphaga sp.]
MKVTANINNDLVESVMELSGGKNRTEGLIIALEDYVYRKKIEQFIDDIHKNP